MWDRATGDEALTAELVIALARLSNLGDSTRAFRNQHLECVLVYALQDMLESVRLGHGGIDAFAQVDDVLNIAGKVLARLLRARVQALFRAKLSDNRTAEDFAELSLERCPGWQVGLVVPKPQVSNAG